MSQLFFANFICTSFSFFFANSDVIIGFFLFLFFLLAFKLSAHEGNKNANASIFSRTPTVRDSVKKKLTLDAVQVGRGQRLGLALVGGDALVLGLLGTRHVARAAPLLQVVAAAGGGLAAQRLVLGRRESGGGAGSFWRGGFTEQKDDKRSFLVLFYISGSTENGEKPLKGH